LSRLERFLAELQRRRVYRVAVAYAVVGLGVLEGTDVLVPALGLPPRLVTAAAVVSLVGFPIALFLAWRYQLTADGLHTSEPVPGGIEPEQRPGRLLPLVAAGAAMAFVGFAGGWLLRPTSSAVNRIGGVPIAILPFTNLSGPDDAYFTDGLHEEIIARLSHAPSFRVTSRTSVMGYRADPKPIREISAELGVDAVLEGSVRRAGNTLRMTAQLVDARRDENLWSASYDREYSLEAVLAIQEDVAREVASALRVVLAEDAPRPAPPTRDLEAYELYLLGRTHWNARSPEDLRRAIELFEQAIGQDAAFARAWAGLADAYAVLPAYDSEASARDAMPQASEAAARALSLDPNLAEAHASLGFVAFTFDWEPDEALDRFARAVALNPSHAPALYWQGWLLGLLGRFDEGRRLLEQALAVAPRSVGALYSVGSAYMLNADYPAARSALSRAVELDPAFAPAWGDLGTTEYLAGDREAGLRGWGRLVETMGWSDETNRALERVSEDPRSARTALREALPVGEMLPQDVSIAVSLYAAAADTTTAVSLIRRLHETRIPGLARLYQLPHTRPFLVHPDLRDVTAEFRDRFGLSFP
jgi:TolB-like protein/Tfp pilus assembly protein PilF